MCSLSTLPTLNESVKTIARLLRDDLVRRGLAKEGQGNEPASVIFRDIQGVVDDCQTRIDEIKLGLPSKEDETNG